LARVRGDWSSLTVSARPTRKIPGLTARPINRAAISWSGGKDSCLALIRAAESGMVASTLLTMADPDGSTKSHALPELLIAAQAEAMRLRQVSVVAEMGNYGRIFLDALTALREHGHTHMIFGDIDLQAHRDWLEPVCARAGLEAVFPLWAMPRRAVAEEIIERGIRARLVCVDTRHLDESYCGAEFDRDLLARLPAGVCPCGEDGEFHTFVWDAPLFQRPLHLSAGARIRVASKPPLAATQLAFQIPELLVVAA
jgi:diphthine-ammonia ligase